MTQKTKPFLENALFEAILQLRSLAECRAFFADLCTPAEIKAMTGRFQVCQLLLAGEHSYREIHQKTGVSLATITRVARFLNQESNQGYRLILERLSASSRERR